MIFRKNISISAILEQIKSGTLFGTILLDFRAPKSFRRRDFPIIVL